MTAETILDEYIADECGGDGQAKKLRENELIAALVLFRNAVEDYTRSPYFTHYITHYKGSGLIFPKVTPDNLDGLVAVFSDAVREGQTARVLEAAADIRSIVLFLQTLETEASDTMFLRTFIFFGCFVLIIFILMFFIWTLQRSLRFSRVTEKDSVDFSRKVLAAQETERLRISAEIHDTVLQDLSRLVQMSKETAAGENEILATGKRILENCRSICENIMPPDFSRLNFEDSLVELCMNTEKRTGRTCRAGIQRNLVFGNLGPDRQLQCYRIIQEALTNIEKHAQAREILLTLRNAEKDRIKTLLIFISDDGIGLSKTAAPGAAFPPGKGGTHRLGIRGMYERAAILGGSLSFISEEGHGLTVRLEIPIGEKP
jgi:signal transduction histidine kinase